MTSYKCLACDPPWLERGGGKSKRGADRHYQLMDKKEILSTMREALGLSPIHRSLVAASCHLWMWATSNYLPDALWVMGGLGFEYKTSAVWVKVCPVKGLQKGLGQYMRHSHEWLLLGTRGDAMVPEPADRMPSVIFAPRTRHSTKPQEAYDLIERCSPGPRLECFARTPRDGWTVWGNEVPNHGERNEDSETALQTD